MAPQTDALFREAFEAELLDAVEKEPNTALWSAAGKGKKKANPAGEDGTWWRENGPGMVEAWINWRNKSKWKVWTTPDGEPAIELAADVLTPEGRLVRGFIDRVMVTPHRQLVIVDLKSGARVPESDLQLGFYRYFIHKKFGVDVRLGSYWMARQGEMGDVYDIGRFKPALIEAWLRRFDRAIEEKIFIPHPTFRCRACSHRRFCTAFGGSEQHLDPDYTLGEAA